MKQWVGEPRGVRNPAAGYEIPDSDLTIKQQVNIRSAFGTFPLASEATSLATSVECTLLLSSVVLLLISEAMAFVACFWCHVANLLLCPASVRLDLAGNPAPCFSIPYANLAMLLFSSFPLQAALVASKLGSATVVLVIC